MSIIPVIDIQHGIAVRGIAGDRANYQPLKSIWTDSVEPVSVARALWQAYRPQAIYIADLDAIADWPPNDRVYDELTRDGIAIWLDAGLRNIDDAVRFDKVAGVVIGLETLADPDSLPQIVAAIGPDRAFFSLDLKAGRTLGTWGSDAFHTAEIAIAAGIRRMILLDLARVGTGTGLGTEALAARIRKHHPQVKIILGGGISSRADIEKLQGIDAVLIASALHDGRINPI